tara:strand:+ start:3929 stop:4489 length:561 start_codon:yes stop_codon:yes gene_type:complete
MKCLFLGYNRKKTKIIKFIEKEGLDVHQTDLSVNENISNYDLIISFGYRRIIKRKILKLAKRPIINLHMSYLPFNRGSHPSFWSFYKNTIKGVTIHEMNDKIDAGPIIIQKKINFNISKNKRTTFNQVYKKSFIVLENLFIKNFKKIRLKNYKLKKNLISKGSIHKKKDLPKKLKSFEVIIHTFLK